MSAIIWEERVYLAQSSAKFSPGYYHHSWQRPIQKMQGDISCPDFKLVEPWVLGSGGGCVLPGFPPSLLVQVTHILSWNLGSAGEAHSCLGEGSMKAPSAVLLRRFEGGCVVIIPVIYLDGPANRNKSLLSLMGHWPVFRAGSGKQKQETRQGSKWRLGRLQCSRSLGTCFFPGFFYSWFFTGHVTAHTKGFIFSYQHTRLKPCLCPGWCAWELCGALGLSLWWWGGG